jgi:F-type H+-transporting ATPase subunit delta
MSETITIARPYATAAFDQATQEDALESWESALQLMSSVLADPTVSRLVNDPKKGREDAKKLLINICHENTSISQQNFLKILADNQRLNLLNEIVQLFGEMSAELKKRISVQVNSAYKLSDEQITKLSSSLEKRLGCAVDIQMSIDKTLMGSVLIRTQDTVIDHSVRSQLKQLSYALHQ